MSSDNPSGADNQQETKATIRTLDPSWIVGFVDGEGCFSVSVHRNQRYARRTGGWQLTPVFQVYQHEKERLLLERIRDHFGCGRLYHKGPRSSVLTYSVGRLRDLENRVVPFFEEYQPIVKDADFRIFAEIVRSMRRRDHRQPDGFDQIVRLAYTMNAHGKQRVTCDRGHPAGILRDCTPGTAVSAVMRQSDPHGDMRSQAEMTWPAHAIEFPHGAK